MTSCLFFINKGPLFYVLFLILLLSPTILKFYFKGVQWLKISTWNKLILYILLIFLHVFLLLSTVLNILIGKFPQQTLLNKSRIFCRAMKYCIWYHFWHLNGMQRFSLQKHWFCLNLTQFSRARHDWSIINISPFELW